MKSTNDLPLSWERVNCTQPHFLTIPLRKNKTNWFSLAEIPESWDFKPALKEMKIISPGGIVIRGCSKEISNFVCAHQFQCIQIAVEAVLNLHGNHFNKKSLRLLIKRGLRHGSVREIEYNKENHDKILSLKQQSPHGSKPQLRYLFRTEFEANTRCFVFETLSKSWLAAITISKINFEKYQTEMLVRVFNAPVGIMEALIHSIFRQLQEEKYRYWSLGEVPFTGINSQHGVSIKEKIIKYGAPLFTYAYNYKTLYTFKNKFNPVWQEIYLCGYPSITYRTLWNIFIKSNFLKLILFPKGN